jgi:hypothetical protein
MAQAMHCGDQHKCDLHWGDVSQQLILIADGS